MVDPATIITLLAGGAIAKMQGLGGQAVMDAYSALKQVLTDVYGFAAASLLEKKPEDDATRKVAEQDIPSKATTDPEVVRKIQELEDALATIPRKKWESVGVVIEGLTARRNIDVGDVKAGTHGVTIRRIRSEEGDIKLGNISG
jgi:hypothetical protein